MGKILGYQKILDYSAYPSPTSLVTHKLLQFPHGFFLHCYTLLHLDIP